MKTPLKEKKRKARVAQIAKKEPRLAMHQPPVTPHSGSWLLALSREASKLGVSF